MNHELRSGFKWTINECLRLEREYDLLKLSVDEIALLHQRSHYAIMCKLDAEGIADFNKLYQQNYHSNEESDVNEDSESEEGDDEESYQDEEQEFGDDDSQVSEEDENKNDDSDNEYHSYDLKKQVSLLAKQLSNLTAIVYKSLIKESRTGNVLFR
jgi:hypothetical protein